MLCGRCCATEPPSRPVLQLDIFIEILLRGWVNRVASDALRAYDKPLIHNTRCFRTHGALGH
jgi:hypothetical protein